MANVDRVNGFKPIRHLNGSPYNGAVTTYNNPGATVYVGDPVKLVGSSLADGTQNISVAAPGDAIVGVVCGFEVDPDNLGVQIGVAGRKVLVADSPDIIFEVQGDGVLAVASYGLNCNHINGGGSAVTGSSGCELDVSTAAVTATLTFKIRRATQRVDNDIAATNAKIEVSINSHQLVAGTVGI